MNRHTKGVLKLLGLAAAIVATSVLLQCILQTPARADERCVIVTGYSSTPGQTDSTPFITAWNTTVQDGVIALSRDLLKRYTLGAPFAFGDIVEIEGLGVFTVEDTMNRRWTNRADIWFPTRAEAKRFGSRELLLTNVED